LDPLASEKKELPGEDKCRAEKPSRQRIAMKYPGLLPHQGLTEKQWHNKERWEALSPKERALRLQRLENARKLRKSGILEPKPKEIRLKLN